VREWVWHVIMYVFIAAVTAAVFIAMYR